MIAKPQQIYQELASEGNQERDGFARRLSGIPYEHKGILYSEMFFLWLCTRKNKPGRVIESGRARGQSTLVLARIFPDAEIISIEHDKNSPDVAIAEERLREYKNVQLLFGDATKLLPAMVRQGDVVLIDGPKGFRGVRLAIQLLGSGKVDQVFLHDTTVHTPEREFLERYLPDSLYSDASVLAAGNHELDSLGKIDLPEALRYAEGLPYGFSLASLRSTRKFSPNALALASRYAQFVGRIRQKVEG